MNGQSPGGELAHRLETAHSFSCGECRKARKPQKGFRAWPFGLEEKAIPHKGGIPQNIKAGGET